MGQLRLRFVIDSATKIHWRLRLRPAKRNAKNETNAILTGLAMIAVSSAYWWTDVASNVVCPMLAQ